MSRFSHVGTDKDGAPILREWTAEENARRDAEEAEHAAHVNDPPPPPPRDAFAEIDALKVEVEKLKEPK